MKKMIKLSLVAAVAVAGLTTTSSAANLEDAIKGTQLNGYVRYRIHQDHENDTDMTEEAKAVMKFTTKVNDAVKANVKFVSFAATVKGQTAANTSVVNANFVINAAGATVIAGLQTSQSPFFANNGDTRSHGVTALIPAGAVTLAAAYYTTSVGGDMVKSGSGVLANDVLAIGAIGKFGAVNVQAWYASVEDSADVEDVTLTGVQALAAVPLEDATALNLNVSAKLGAINVQAITTQISANDLDFGQSRIVVSGKADKFSYTAAYAMSNEDGGMSALDRDDDAVSDFGLYTLAMGATADATAFMVKGKIQATPTVCASIAHLSGSEGDKGNDESFNETDVKVGYKMSKNFNAYALYAMGEYNKSDFASSRIEVKYTF